MSNLQKLFLIISSFVLVVVLMYFLKLSGGEYFDLSRYLLLVPILVAALVFDFSGGVYASCIAISLYAPVFFERLEKEGFNREVYEIIFSLIIFSVIGCAVGFFSGFMKNKKDTYRAFSRIGEAISCSFSLDQLLSAVCCELVSIMKSEEAMIVFSSQSGDSFILRSGEGDVLRISDGSEGFEFLKSLMAIKNPVFSNNLRMDERFIVDDSADIIAFMAGPIIVKNKTIGLVIVFSEKNDSRYTIDSAQMLFGISSQIGSHIANLKFYEMAIVDGLTGIYNHRFFRDKLTEEMLMGGVSLMLVDIDHFKKINDTYGHPGGDIVLKEVAIIMKEVTRDYGFVCRYGGEEFAVILKEVDKNKAFLVAERIRQAISGFKFNLYGKIVSVTVSIGVSRGEGSSMDDVVRMSDEALYRAKHGGRNRVCLY